MRIFLAVARDDSLSAAARHLKVTQPTVGRRLGQLEANLDARLFDRLTDGFVPTQAGEELLPIAGDMKKAAHTLQRRQATLAEAVGARQQALPRVRVGRLRRRPCLFRRADMVARKLAGRAPAVRMNNGHAIHDAVCMGAGLGLLPCFAADADPGLVRLTTPIQGAESDLNLVVHRDLKRVPSVRAVMDELIRLFKQEAPRLAGRGRREAAA